MLDPKLLRHLIPIMLLLAVVASACSLQGTVPGDGGFSADSAGAQRLLVGYRDSLAKIDV